MNLRGTFRTVSDSICVLSIPRTGSAAGKGNRRLRCRVRGRLYDATTSFTGRNKFSTALVSTSNGREPDQLQFDDVLDIQLVTCDTVDVVTLDVHRLETRGHVECAQVASLLVEYVPRT